MSDFEPVRLIPYALIILLTAIPAWFLLRRTGKSRAWVLLAVVPLGTFVILWILAFSMWPREGKGTSA